MELRDRLERNSALAEVFCRADERVAQAQRELDDVQTERVRVLAALAVTVGSDSGTAHLLGMHEREVRVARRTVGRAEARDTALTLLEVHRQEEPPPEGEELEPDAREPAPHASVHQVPGPRDVSPHSPHSPHEALAREPGRHRRRRGPRPTGLSVPEALAAIRELMEHLGDPPPALPPLPGRQPIPAAETHPYLDPYPYYSVEAGPHGQPHGPVHPQGGAPYDQWQQSLGR